jgi:predicted nucleotidyltransferase
MAKKRRTNGEQKANGLYQAPNVPMSAIRRFAKQVAERFHPEKIILFGSYAYGKTHRNSDVDILVVMPARDETSRAVKIRSATDHPFFLDLIVRTPENLRWRLDEGDWFLREIVDRGKILYEKANRRLGSQGRGRRGRRQKSETRQAALK